MPRLRLRRCPLLPLLVCAGALGVAVPAFAAPRVAVLRVDFEGKIPEASKVFLSERLVEGLAAAGFETSAGDVLKSALASGGGPTPQSCRDDKCYRLIAARAGLDYLVIAQVSAKSTNYNLKLQLIGGSDGRPAGQQGDRCELCGMQEVGEKLDKLAASLSAYLETRKAVAPARITVQSRPIGASVTIDGRAAGETPFSIDLSAGTHELAINAAGHAGARKKITLEPGIRGLVSVDMIPLSASGGPPPQLAVRRWRAMGWLATALGVASIGAGVGMVFWDHSYTSCPPVPGQTDPAQMNSGPCYRNTKMAAGAFFGAGGVALATGGLFLYFGYANSGSSHEEAVLSGSYLLSLRGRF